MQGLQAWQAGRSSVGLPERQGTHNVASNDTDQSPRRYRVVLVRWPPKGAGGLARVLPGGHVPKRDALPVVVRVTEHREQAEETAGRIRGAGAGVVVLGEYADLPVVCQDHPPELVRGACRRCGRDVCAGCLLDADGDRLCPGCAAENRAGIQRIHTRQLFVVFLFCAFLYQVFTLWRRDEDIRAGWEVANVAVIQFVPPGQLIHPMVQGLSGQAGGAWEGPTYADVVSLFDRERRRFSGQLHSSLRLSVRGPWQERPEPPSLVESMDSPLRAGIASLRYSWFWKRLAERHGVESRYFPLRMFVIFTDEEGDSAAMSRAALGGNLAVTYISLDDPNPTYAAITVAHELAHLLGASDKYGPDGLARIPEGYVEPWSEPMYPQRFAELMAVDIPISRTHEREPTSLEQVRFGHRSAAEMGWISDDQAESFYRGLGVSPEAKLPDAPESSETTPPEDASALED